ncbi:hypothetical protein BB561_006302 [Smittium simulii]|uniref:Uncharacterized protein n=1 Tax=Smittium simulii TaxID=133385 RepID=A0A2T9Y584_9FUNG|nr:hypothetical protein BB561_006302 [Smittium simulii]
MGGYVPLFLLICGGLTLGQLIVETCKYYAQTNKYKNEPKSEYTYWKGIKVNNTHFADDSC